MNSSSAVAFVSLSEGEREAFRSYLKSECDNEKGLIVKSYPDENESVLDFNEFFETPYRYGRFSHDFKGTYAVDITPYLRKGLSPALMKLRKYADDNPRFSFILFTRDEEGDTVALERGLEKCFRCSERGIGFYVFRDGKMSPKSGREQKKAKSYGY